MTLAALIIADDEGFAGTAIKGEATLFGMTLIEYQARLACQAGATHIIIASAQVPASLVAALDRLRADGMNSALVRSAREAADSIHPEEGVLLFAPHCLPSRGLVERLANSRINCVVVSPLKAMAPSRELIDAEHDWAGLARIEGKLVRHTASMLGDWSLGSTVLRIAVQAGADRLLVNEGEGLTVATLISRNDGKAAEQRLVDMKGNGVADRLAGLLARGLAATTLPSRILSILPLALLATALLGAGTGWYKMGLLLTAAAPLFGQAMQRFVDASLHASKPMALFDKAQSWAGRAVLLIVGWAMVQAGLGWGALVVALWLIWILWDRQPYASRYGATEASSALLTFAGLLFGHPLWGMGLALGHGLFQPLLQKLRPALTKPR